MKILITGGAGFIGSHLTQLLSVDHEVIIYDIQEPKQKNVDFIIGDVNDAQKNLESCKDIDIVIHLAASVGVENTETDPIMTLNSNILGTKEILESLDSFESRSMHGQIPIIWDSAKDFNIYDIKGNKFIDFTSAIFLSTSSREFIRAAKVTTAVPC